MCREDFMMRRSLLSVTLSFLLLCSVVFPALSPFSPQAFAQAAPTLSSVTVPASALSGRSVTVKVTLSVKAPVGGGGVAVALTSSDPTLIPVPPSITVPENTKAGSVSVTLGAVATDTPVTVTASYGGVDQSATITVLAPQLTAVTAPATSLGGRTINVTARVNADAPAGGLAVPVTSSNPDTIPEPGVIQILAGERTGTAQVVVSAPAAATDVALTGTLNGVQQSTLVSVAGLALVDITAPETTAAGRTINLRVTVNSAAPATGALVALTSDSALISVPANVTVPAGLKVVVVPVWVEAPLTETVVTLGASLYGSSVSTSVIVQPLDVSSVAVPATTQGSKDITVNVTLNVVAPVGGVNVSLSSSSQAHIEVPATIFVAGGSRTASIPVPVLASATDTPVTVSASLGSNPVSDTVTVLAPNLTSLSAPTNINANSSATATVRVNRAPGLESQVVTLESSNPAVLTVPGTVEITTSGNTATFTITSAGPAVDTPVTITATLNGLQVTDTINVRADPNPPSVQILEVSFTGLSLLVGDSGTATIRLDAPAPAGGLTILTSSTDTGVLTVPASVPVSAGATEAPLPISFVGAGNAEIVLTLGAQTFNVPVGVGAKSVIKLNLDQAAVPLYPGEERQVIAGVNFPAPAGGTIVMLESSDPLVATVPGTMTIGQGNFENSVALTAVGAGTTTITASYNGTSRTLDVTVSPWNGPVITGAYGDLTVARGGVDYVELAVTFPEGTNDDGLTAISSNPAIFTAEAVWPPEQPCACAGILGARITGVSNGWAYLHFSFGGPVFTVAVTVVDASIQYVDIGSPAMSWRTHSGYISLDGPAPAGGFIVDLTSSNPNVATVDATFTIPEGEAGAEFAINPVGPGNTTITVSNGAQSFPVVLTIEDPRLIDLSVYEVVDGEGAVSYQGAISANGPWGPGDLELTVLATNPNQPAVEFPVVLPEGESWVTFPITMVGEGVTTYSVSHGGVDLSYALTVGSGGAISVEYLSDLPEIAVGAFGSMLVRLNEQVSDETELTITSSDPAVVFVEPASIMFYPGQDENMIYVTGIAEGTATLTLTIDGNPFTREITVVPVGLRSLDVLPTITVGNNTYGAVLLNGPAPEGGLTVSLSSTDPFLAAVDDELVIAEGLTIGEFLIVPASPGQTDIVASFNGDELTATVTVEELKLKSFVLTADDVTVTGRFYGVVLLNGTSTEDIVISAISTDETVAAMPPTLTIEAGSTTAWFQITPLALGTTTIQLSWNGVTLERTMTVEPLRVIEICCAPAYASAGSTAYGYILLNGKVQSEGFAVSATSSNPSVASVPTTFPFESGLSDTGFAVQLLQPGTADITITLGDSSVVLSLTVGPIIPVSVSVPSSQAIAGSTATGTVHLTGDAPAGGLVVSLASSDSDVADVPATVTVEEGSRSAEFQVTYGTAGESELSATVNGSIAYREISVREPELVRFELSIAGQPITPGSAWGLDLEINVPASESGIPIQLSNSNPDVVALPASVVTVQDGEWWASGSFEALTIGTATITATLGSTTLEVQVTVVDNGIWDLSGDSGIVPGETTDWTVSLARPAGPGGAVVSLQAAHEGIVDLPPTVEVGEGLTTATFQVTALGLGTTDIIASVGDHSLSADIEVFRLGVSYLYLATDFAVVGSQNRMVVYLNGPAPAGGAVITLTSHQPGIVLANPTVTIPEGATSTNFDVFGVASGYGYIGAGFDQSYEEVGIDVFPMQFSWSEVDRSELTVGESAEISVYFSLQVPHAGLSMDVVSSDPAVIAVESQTVSLAPLSGYRQIGVTAVGAGVATVTLSIGEEQVQFDFSVTGGDPMPTPTAPAQPDPVIDSYGFSPGSVFPGMTINLGIWFVPETVGSGFTITIGVDDETYAVPASATAYIGSGEASTSLSWTALRAGHVELLIDLPGQTLEIPFDIQDPGPPGGLQITTTDEFGSSVGQGCFDLYAPTNFSTPFLSFCDNQENVDDNLEHGTIVLLNLEATTRSGLFYMLRQTGAAPGYSPDPTTFYPSIPPGDSGQLALVQAISSINVTTGSAVINLVDENWNAVFGACLDFFSPVDDYETVVLSVCDNDSLDQDSREGWIRLDNLEQTTESFPNGYLVVQSVTPAGYLAVTGEEYVPVSPSGVGAATFHVASLAQQDTIVTIYLLVCESYPDIVLVGDVAAGIVPPGCSLASPETGPEFRVSELNGSELYANVPVNVDGTIVMSLPEDVIYLVLEPIPGTYPLLQEPEYEFVVGVQHNETGTSQHVWVMLAIGE
jgi:hypothetical protein